MGLTGRNQSVTDFMIGNHHFFLFGKDLIFLLITGQNNFYTFFQIGLVNGMLAHSYGSVELKIDEATIPKNEDKLRQPEKLDLETGNKSTASPQKQQEIRRVGRHLGAIEQELFDKLVKLDAQKQEISSAQASGLLDNYDSLLKISQIKLQQAKLIELAMQEKLKVLDEAVELTEDEKAKDRERIQQRMQAAQQKQQEYNQVISEITANPEVFHKL